MKPRVNALGETVLWVKDLQAVKRSYITGHIGRIAIATTLLMLTGCTRSILMKAPNGLEHECGRHENLKGYFGTLAVERSCQRLYERLGYERVGGTPVLDKVEGEQDAKACGELARQSKGDTNLRGSREYKKFVTRCLKERGYDVLGWQ